MPIDPTKRLCPRDGATLVKKAEMFVTLDVCPKCEGSFYERGEAETALSAGADVELLVKNGQATMLERSGTSCPACSSGMRGVRVVMRPAASAAASEPAYFKTADSAFEIDSCPRCAGLWLDAGEADKLTQVGRESRSSLIAQRDAAAMPTEEPPKRGWAVVLDVLGIKTPDQRRRERM